MNEIIKNIEAAQLKAEVTQFNVGDTVRVYAKVKEGNRESLFRESLSFLSATLPYLGSAYTQAI